MSRLPASNSYYPLPVSTYGHRTRSPPPFSPSFRLGHSSKPSVGSKRPFTPTAVSTVDPAGDSLATATRHPDLWFSDGSIVLRAEDTLFRVHKSLLARHSGFFHDLFSLPQLVEDAVSSSSCQNASLATVVGATGDVEGCPVLRLHDAAEDVANLLTALVDGPNFGNNDLADFQVVSGILRLATKYVVDSLREKALDHLTLAWPTTLKGWDAREDIARSRELQDGSTSMSIYPSPMAVISLAREVNAPALLPSAFYDLSRYHFS